RELPDKITAGKEEPSLLMGVNPSHSPPADLSFHEALHRLLTNADKKDAVVAHLSNFHNETTDYAHWHVPEAHYLEAWSDARAVDGTATIIQPMILPLFNGKSPHEILAIFPDHPRTPAYTLSPPHC